MRSRRARTPSGVEWRVGRRWISRGLPRWRGVRRGQDVDEVFDDAWFVPIDAASIDDLGVLLGGILAAIVIALVLIPLLLFGVELIILAMIVAAGIVARSMLGRPWIVQATPRTNPSDTLTWKVKGWRHSTELIDEVATSLAAGLPPPGRDSGESGPVGRGAASRSAG